METQHLADRLRTVQHFRGLPWKDILSIVTAGQVHRYREREMILEEGEPCAGMLVLISGQVNLCKYGPEGQQNIISTLDPVIMFNEVAALDGGPNPVCALAVKDSVIWRINYDSFQTLLKRYPEIGLGLLRVLARRQRQMLSHYEDLSFRTVQARMAKLLLELSKNGKHPIERRLYSINNLAARISTVPEAVSRSLNSFNKAGLIRSNRSTILVLSPEELAEQAQIPLI
jgi:CRP-like cAMP-binding protein